MEISNLEKKFVGVKLAEKKEEIAQKLKANIRAFYLQLKQGCYRNNCYNPYCQKGNCKKLFSMIKNYWPRLCDLQKLIIVRIIYVKI